MNILTCRDLIKSRSGVKIIIAVVRVTTWNVSKKNVRPAEIYSEKFISSLNARGSCVLLRAFAARVRSRRTARNSGGDGNLRRNLKETSYFHGHYECSTCDSRNCTFSNYDARACKTAYIRNCGSL